MPMRLFAGGNAKFWDPRAVDLSQDAADWSALSERERLLASILCASFIAGEEAVTEDIQPFIRAMARTGRLEDEMYLTQFAFEEAKHVQAFRLWLAALELVSFPFSLFGDDVPFELSLEELVNYAMQRGARRLDAIGSARGRSEEDIDRDDDPIALEEQMAEEDAA